MSSVLMLGHRLFLTKEQRYALKVPEAEVEVIGYCYSLWSHQLIEESKIIEEVFAKYRILHCPKPETQTINFTSEGFIIRLSPNFPIFLLDGSDGGNYYLELTHKNILPDDKVVLHFLSIEDLRVLEETLC